MSVSSVRSKRSKCTSREDTLLSGSEAVRNQGKGSSTLIKNIYKMIAFNVVWLRMTINYPIVQGSSSR